MDQTTEQEMKDKAARQVVQIEWNSRLGLFVGCFTAGMVYKGFWKVIGNQAALAANQRLILEGIEHISGQVVELAAESVSVKDVLRLAADQVK